MNARSVVQGAPRNMTVTKADHNQKMSRLGVLCVQDYKMPQIISMIKDDLHLVLLLSCFVRHPVSNDKAQLDQFLDLKFKEPKQKLYSVNAFTKLCYIFILINNIKEIRTKNDYFWFFFAYIFFESQILEKNSKFSLNKPF